MCAKPTPNLKKAELRKDVEKRLSEMTPDDMSDQSKTIISKVIFT